MPTTQYHPTIYRYLKKFQDDPNSRVFAPLAEAYRKAGLVDEAIKIAQEGVRVHPHFVGGRVALARSFFDKRLFHEVIQELAGVVQDVPDNLIAQRLLAESYLILGQIAPALTAFKMLLYFSPQDTETARIVQELEAQAYEKGTLILRTDPVVEASLPQFAEKSASQALESAPDVQRVRRIQKIEFLQELLQRVERYRVRNEMGHSKRVA
jgi:tetratricopeptide (TPR) repeat protein